jgi:ribosome-associated protein
MDLRITDDLVIDDSELEYEFARSGGPGGQNVNKVETKVTVLWDLAASPCLDVDQRARLEARLANRITKDGVLRVTSQRHRTREANRADALDRFVELVADALIEQPRRKRTRTPTKAKRKRLEAKRRRSEKKALRGPVDHD